MPICTNVFKVIASHPDPSQEEEDQGFLVIADTCCDAVHMTRTFGRGFDPSYRLRAEALPADEVVPILWDEMVDAEFDEINAAAWTSVEKPAEDWALELGPGMLAVVLDDTSVITMTMSAGNYRFAWTASRKAPPQKKEWVSLDEIRKATKGKTVRSYDQARRYLRKEQAWPHSSAFKRVYGLTFGEVQGPGWSSETIQAAILAFKARTGRMPTAKDGQEPDLLQGKTWSAVDAWFRKQEGRTLKTAATL